MSAPSPALVTGVTGQDGIYLTRLLRGLEVPVVGTHHGDPVALARVSAYLSGDAGTTVGHLDLRDLAPLPALLAEHRPTRVFHLAGFSSVARSHDSPDLVREVNDVAVASLLDAVRAHRDRTRDDVRVFVASSAVVGREPTPSPYGLSKAAAEEHVRTARAQGLWACSARLHNHESPLREPQFVTRKIAAGVALIAAGKQDELVLGSLDVRRDWGHARDLVSAMRLMLETGTPTDLELGTGTAHALRDLVDCAFAAAGLGGAAGASAYVRSDPALLRRTDAAEQVADPEPAARVLGWRATTSLAATVEHLVEVEQRRLATGVEDDPSYL